MANEKLVSSIYFRGGKVSSSELDVIDTSLPATYEISIINNDGHVIPDALDIQVGLTTAVLARQVPKRNDVPKFWYGLTGAAASKFDLYTGDGGKQPLLGEVSVPTNALVIFSLQVNHYPSLVDLDATLDLYHDAARTQKFASIPIRSKAVTDVSLKLTSMRNLNNQPEMDPVGIYSNDVLVVHYTDPNINRSNYVIIPFKTKINGVDVPAGFYPPGGASWLVDQWYNDVRGYGTSGEFSVLASRQKNPTVSGNVVIEVTMGDLIVTNTLVDSDISYLRGHQNLSIGTPLAFLPVPAPLPASTASLTDIYNPNLSIGYSFLQSAPVPPANPTAGNPPAFLPHPPASNYLTSMITKRSVNNAMEILPNGFEWATNSQAPAPFFAYPKGDIGYLAWDHTKLDTVKKRKQFGKYQKSISLIFKLVQDGAGIKYNQISGATIIFDDFLTANLKVNDIQDPIATAQYGALTTLDPTTLAVFTFVTRDQSLVDPKFALEGAVGLRNGNGLLSVKFTDYQTRWQGTLPAANPTNPTDLQFRTDILFLRNNGRNEKNTFDSDTTYPRIVNVQTNRGYDAYLNTNLYGTFWDFEIDPSLGIDLTDNRYSFVTSVHNDSQHEYDFFSWQMATLVGRSPNKLTFRYGYVTSMPHMSLAIIENGPTPIPVAGNFIFKPVNIPNGNWTVYIGAGSPIVGLSYGAGTVIKGSSKVSNYGMKIFAVMANHNANRTGFTYGIQVDFFNFPIGESSLDDVTIKPTTVFAQVNNGIKHKLTRWTFDGDPVTGSRQRYIFQGANATTTNLDAWVDDFTANIGKETNFTVSLF